MQQRCLSKHPHYSGCNCVHLLRRHHRCEFQRRLLSLAFCSSVILPTTSLLCPEIIFSPRDLQSYLSNLNLFLAPESRRFYVLVDNRPWLQDLVSGPAHFWQFMVTKSRLSPFANTKKPKDRSSKLKASRSKSFKKLSAMIDAATQSRKKRKALIPVKKLRKSLDVNSNLNRTLYGFIVFEVAWSDVRGINYLNELQSDTYLAVEAKFMNRWEFDSIEQAARCISSWFTGTYIEHFLFKDYLLDQIGEVFYEAQDEFPNKKENMLTENSCLVDEKIGPYESTVIKSTSPGVDRDINFEETPIGRSSFAIKHEESVESSQLKDVLLMFRFSDLILPFKLKEIIMSELRLLTLLELGLPSWVIFLQSYPVLCHIYRPWMNPLARALYGLISTVTVLIGFYDLYKNVPVLRATASQLFGPLFDWIETWEMLSRIKYLGTMLFLHNFKKALKCILKFSHGIKSVLSFIAQPVAGPTMMLLNLLLPLWTVCYQFGEALFSVIWIVIDCSYSVLESLFEVILFPIWLLFSVIWRIATNVIFPMIWIILELLYAPIRVVFGFSGILGLIFSRICHMFAHMWLFISGLFKFSSGAQSAVRTVEVSVWRSLWNDLFSQVFRALRSILYGFSAFFTACNRHRLSILNHSKEFYRRLRNSDKISPISDSTQVVQARKNEVT